MSFDTIPRHKISKQTKKSLWETFNKMETSHFVNARKSNKSQLLQTRCKLAVSIFIQHSTLKLYSYMNISSVSKTRHIPAEMQLEVMLLKIAIASPWKSTLIFIMLIVINVLNIYNLYMWIYEPTKSLTTCNITTCNITTYEDTMLHEPFFCLPHNNHKHVSL
jgi:hypothetical protein